MVAKAGKSLLEADSDMKKSPGMKTVRWTQHTMEKMIHLLVTQVSSMFFNQSKEPWQLVLVSILIYWISECRLSRRVINRPLMECLDFCEQVKEGNIRHIGFSTHATSEQIKDLLNTERVRLAPFLFS